MANIGYYKTLMENVFGEGENLYVVKLMPYSVIESGDVVKLACADSNINEQDLAVGFSALTQAIEHYVLQGHSVTLDGLGNFRLTAKTGVWDETTQKWISAATENIDEATPDKIRGVYVRFRPCTALRNQLKEVKLFDVTKTAFGKAKTISN